MGHSNSKLEPTFDPNLMRFPYQSRQLTQEGWLDSYEYVACFASPDVVDFRKLEWRTSENMVATLHKKWHYGRSLKPQNFTMI